MLLRRLEHGGPRPTYLVADEESGIALVIDPPAIPELLLDETERLGLFLKHVFFTSELDGALFSSIAFLERGAHVYRSARALPRADVTPLFPGCTITVGRLRLQAIELEGRRISYRVFELDESDEAELVLTVSPDGPALERAPASGRPSGCSFSCW